MTNAISRFFKRSSPRRYSIFSPGGVWGKRAAAGKSRLFLCGLAGTFEARERCPALQDLSLLRIDPSGGLGEGRLVGSRPGVAEVAAPGLAPLRQIGGFICLVSLMLLRTYDGTIWRAFWFGNRSNILPALYFGGATRAPPFF